MRDFSFNLISLSEALRKSSRTGEGAQKKLAVTINYGLILNINKWGNIMSLSEKLGACAAMITLSGLTVGAGYTTERSISAAFHDAAYVSSEGWDTVVAEGVFSAIFAGVTLAGVAGVAALGKQTFKPAP